MAATVVVTRHPALKGDMIKKTWRRGRAGICHGEKAITTSIQLCPSVKAMLLEYCKENGILKSVVINQAIREFIQHEGEAGNDNS